MNYRWVNGRTNRQVQADRGPIHVGLYNSLMNNGFTRHSNAVIIKNILSILHAFIKNWLGIFWATKTLFHDNGREFNNDKTWYEKFSMKVTTVPSHSPYIE